MHCARLRARARTHAHIHVHEVRCQLLCCWSCVFSSRRLRCQVRLSLCCVRAVVGYGHRHALKAYKFGSRNTQASFKGSANEPISIFRTFVERDTVALNQQAVQSRV
eukprot:15473454-Alexandrium_andersonii.AAC.2